MGMFGFDSMIVDITLGRVTILFKSRNAIKGNIQSEDMMSINSSITSNNKVIKMFRAVELQEAA